MKAPPRYQSEPLPGLRSGTAVAAEAPRLSVIVAARNEGRLLDSVLEHAQRDGEAEVIVVDGGSTDDTAAVAERHGARLVRSGPGRAGQLNAGAAVARGDVLVFLHGDTCLPTDFVAEVHDTLQRRGVVAGAFRLDTVAGGRRLGLLCRSVNLRSRWLQLPYGDQALFMRASTFRRLGGFPDLPIMEDFELVRRLRRLGRVALAPAAVRTSARRWQRCGMLRTTLLNQVSILAYLGGVPAARIARWHAAGRASR